MLYKLVVIKNQQSSLKSFNEMGIVCRFFMETSKLVYKYIHVMSSETCFLDSTTIHYPDDQFKHITYFIPLFYFTDENNENIFIYA